MNKVPFWIRLYDLPLQGRTTYTVTQIAQRVGDFLDIDRKTLEGITRCVRIKVLLNLEKPLKRGTKIKIGQEKICWIPIAYERLPNFCYICGHLGHSMKDCDHYVPQPEIRDAQEEENIHPFGDWLRASPMKKKHIPRLAERRNQRNKKETSLEGGKKGGNHRRGKGRCKNQRCRRTNCGRSSQQHGES